MQKSERPISFAQAQSGKCFAIAAPPAARSAQYRGLIPLDRFTCSSIERSSFIRRVCYDRSDVYMVIRLNDTYYHYCDIDKATVDAF